MPQPVLSDSYDQFIHGGCEMWLCAAEGLAWVGVHRMDRLPDVPQPKTICPHFPGSLVYLGLILLDGNISSLLSLSWSLFSICCSLTAFGAPQV